MSEANETKLPPNLYRLSVERYDLIVQLGVIGKQDKVELIEGLIVRKEPGDRSHSLAAKQAMLALLRVLPPGWHVASEKPVVASDWSKPEPDLAVVRGQARDYVERDIIAADVAIVVKIAQSSLECDRTVMARIYATSGIPVYWVLNLVDLQIEVYRKPASGHYDVREDFQFGKEVPLVIQGADVGPIPVVDVLP
jgi:Uma2 family endonuclease